MQHCQWCEGEYLAGIDGQYRVPAVVHYDEYGDLCVMHAEWLNQYLKEMCRDASQLRHSVKRHLFVQVPPGSAPVYVRIERSNSLVVQPSEEVQTTGPN